MAQMTIQQALEVAVEHHQAGRLPEAESLYRQILAHMPQHPVALHLLGVVAHQVHRNDVAIDLISQAIRLHPTEAAFHNNLGEAWREFGDRDKAMECYREALRLNPDFAEAWSNVGNVLCEQKHPEESMEACLKAVRFKPELANAHNNLGNAYEELGRLDEAVACYHEALKYNPHFAKAFNNLAICEHRSLRFDVAMGHYDKAASLDPAFADAHWNRALANLVMGNFVEGWKGYEWRWLSKDFPSPQRNFTQPQWRGERLAGKTLLIHCEQGFGDSVQFCRFVPWAAKQSGARVVFECQPEVLPLLQSLAGPDQVIAAGTDLPPFDVHIPLLSLPAVYGVDLDHLPAETPYLKVPEDRTVQWQQRVEEALASTPFAASPCRRVAASVSSLPSPLALRSPLRIGLCWAGRPTHGDDRNRSGKLADFAPLAAIPNAVFFSLQKGPSADQAKTPPEGMTLIDLTEHLNDFADTAAFIAQLDLVIAVDTVVVHIAGALHKPAWVLLPFCPDWRWLLSRSDTPWYSTVRLFRQGIREGGNWKAVIAQIAKELADFRRG